MQLSQNHITFCVLNGNEEFDIHNQHAVFAKFHVLRYFCRIPQTKPPSPRLGSKLRIGGGLGGGPARRTSSASVIFDLFLKINQHST